MVLHELCLDFCLNIVRKSLLSLALDQLAEFGGSIKHGFDLKLTDANFFDKVDHGFDLDAFFIRIFLLHLVQKFVESCLVFDVRFIGLKRLDVFDKFFHRLSELLAVIDMSVCTERESSIDLRRGTESWALFSISFIASFIGLNALVIFWHSLETFSILLDYNGAEYL